MGLMLSKNIQKLTRGSNSRKGSNRGEAPRPSSPPRGLATILRSPSLTDEFHKFLQDLDEDTEEDGLRQNWLDFVMSCRELKDMIECGTENNSKAKVQNHLRKMATDFFHVKESSKRVSLSNPVLWTKCQGLCVKAKAKSAQDLSPIWLAHDDVIKRLDDIHQPFLLQRYDERNGGNVLSDAVQCLL